MTFTFDTLEYARNLREANVPPDQAEAMAKALKSALSGPTALVTSADLTREITLVRKDLEAMENRLVIKLGGMMIAIAGIAVAILRLT